MWSSCGTGPWAPETSTCSEAHTPGTKELLQVQQGSITVEVADQSVTLDAGDAVAFPGDVAHSYANPGTQPARFTLAVFEPGVGPDSDADHGGRPMPDWTAPRTSSSPAAQVDAAVFALRPDYRALLLAVDGLVPGPSDAGERGAAAGGGGRRSRGARGPAGGAAPARRGLAGGLPGVRGQAATHPQQPGGAAAPRGSPGCRG